MYKILVIVMAIIGSVSVNAIELSHSVTVGSSMSQGAYKLTSSTSNLETTVKTSRDADVGSNGVDNRVKTASAFNETIQTNSYTTKEGVESATNNFRSATISTGALSAGQGTFASTFSKSGTTNISSSSIAQGTLVTWETSTNGGAENGRSDTTVTWNTPTTQTYIGTDSTNSSTTGRNSFIR